MEARPETNQGPHGQDFLSTELQDLRDRQLQAALILSQMNRYPHWKCNSPHTGPQDTCMSCAPHIEHAYQLSIHNGVCKICEGHQKHAPKWGSFANTACKTCNSHEQHMRCSTGKFGCVYCDIFDAQDDTEEEDDDYDKDNPDTMFCQPPSMTDDSGYFSSYSHVTEVDTTQEELIEHIFSGVNTGRKRRAEEDGSCPQVSPNFDTESDIAKHDTERENTAAGKNGTERISKRTRNDSFRILKIKKTTSKISNTGLQTQFSSYGKKKRPSRTFRRQRRNTPESEDAKNEKKIEFATEG
jgi:hypothetical protein